MTERIDTLLKESRLFRPPGEFRKQAHVNSAAVYRRASRNRTAFWAEQARELEWFKPWRRVLQWKPPHAKWFIGGKLNASVNCLDRHVGTARRNKVALLWECEPGDRRAIACWELYREVNRFASALHRLGVKRGDRVAIYLPMIPEVVVAMLACAR
ncbi:MAG: AMP-binding protein, partial [Gemmatimonadetes bacterium]|nr:AMP-binding protein [Gemmatimonadota bacterium]